MMENFKAIFKGRRKQPQTSDSDRTLPTPRPHSEKEHFVPSSENSSVLSSFPDGVELLHGCTDATVDICFVHGLTGNRDSTWTAHGQSTPWPKTLLPSMLKGVRILTYGYDAYIVRKSVASSNY